MLLSHAKRKWSNNEKFSSWPFLGNYLFVFCERGRKQPSKSTGSPFIHPLFCWYIGCTKEIDTFLQTLVHTRCIHFIDWEAIAKVLELKPDYKAHQNLFRPFQLLTAILWSKFRPCRGVTLLYEPWMPWVVFFMLIGLLYIKQQFAGKEIPKKGSRGRQEHSEVPETCLQNTHF